ncbi:MAG: serine/threonine protein kinase [Gammaproteobacteria bacterium]|nr:serine/threonine protein kinase [Gammaproteobacteria bacterium]
MESSVHPYSELTPDRVLAAIEALGFIPDARIYPLNSYENRVYQIGIEGGSSVIAKFYRPGRWSDEQILEEHAFAQELLDLEVPVAAPMQFNGKQTLMHDGIFRLAVFPRIPGRAPELDELDSLLIMGRYIGRVHLAGARTTFLSRQELSIEAMTVSSKQFLLDNDFIPVELLNAYETLAADLIEKVYGIFKEAGVLNRIRIHGDCHLGNVLWHNEIPHFVDFDDAMMGPAMQDLWMLLSGDRNQKQGQLMELIEGYNEFYDFHPQELVVIEALRTMRIMHYSAWLARRWQDPAFPKCFPWFNTQRYWAEHILELREQMAALDEPPLQFLQ